jgi:hypothetical protein
LRARANAAGRLTGARPAVNVVFAAVSLGLFVGVGQQNIAGNGAMETLLYRLGMNLTCIFVCALR